jgi:hypothetical protein
MRQDGVVHILQTEEGAWSGLAPSLSWRYTQKPVGKEKTRKKAMGFVGCGTGRRDSGIRRVDDYRRSYEAVGRIESRLAARLCLSVAICYLSDSAPIQLCRTIAPVNTFLFAALRRNHDMAEKKQWIIRVEDQLIDQLNTLAPNAGYASGNEFAAEALDIWAETLADLMIKFQEIERNAVKHQREQLLAKLRQVQESGTDRRK